MEPMKRRMGVLTLNSLLTLALAASNFLATPPAFSQDSADGDQSPCPGVLGRCWQGMAGDYGYGSVLEPYKALNLSEQQRNQANQIQERMHEKQTELMEEMRMEYAMLQNMRAAKRPDPVAIYMQQKKIADLRRLMTESRIDAISRINDLLTPEQRSQLSSSGKH